MKKEKRTKPSPKPAPPSKDLKKINFHINAFGEIVRDVNTDDINAFLDENVPDKKFTEDEESERG